VTLPTRADCAARDAADPLRTFRERFHLPPGVIYLDGNSLGAMPLHTPGRLQSAIEQEWGHDLIRGWNSAGWYTLPRRIGDKIARLIGANPGEVVVADSTSINLFKVLSAALRLRPGRRIIRSEPENFPTDLYMAQGLLDLLSPPQTPPRQTREGLPYHLELHPGESISDAIDEQTAVVMLTQVNYRTGYRYDMNAITRRAHEVGALVIWDLAHSAGAMPVDLNGCEADFAIGCGYKYLNGGPGAPAFVFVAERHQAGFIQPLSGWMGHAQPFTFDPVYTPAEGIARYLCGTQPVLSMTALECGVDVLLEADLDAVRAKSLALGDLFIELVEGRCAGHSLDLATPRDPARRGSQVCWRHPEGYAIMQALIERGVIGDFRAPDILRFGLTPLYLGYADVWDAVAIFAGVLESGAWRNPAYQQRAAVT
jgi:kynureninase